MNIRMAMRLCLITSLTLAFPAMAQAETDRITVEDPATSALKFRVTSEGNVTGASFIGAPVDGAVMSIQQGATEAGSAVKLAVKDAAGNAKSVISAKGYVGIGTQTLGNALTIDTSILTGEPLYTPAVLVQGTISNERLEMRSSSAPVFQGRNFNGTVQFPTATTNNAQLFTLGGGGHNGTAFSNNIATIIMRAGENWSTGANGSYIQFGTSPNGTYSQWATERMRLTGDGKLGIGTNAPSQRLEVNGGIRLNTTPPSKPGCETSARGTFWFTQGGTGVKDAAEVCAKDAAGAYAWRTMW